jgi:hypothetical protein
MHTFEISIPPIGDTSIISGKLPKVNNRLLGENSSNLVTLAKGQTILQARRFGKKMESTDKKGHRHVTLRYEHSFQICIVTSYQNGEKYTKMPQNITNAIEIYQIAVQIFPLQGLPKRSNFRFLVSNYTIWQP